LLEQVRWLKEALSSKDILAANTHYLVRNGYIHAKNGRMAAAMPVDCDLEFAVPGEAFEKTLARAPGEVSLSLADGPNGVPALTVRSGRFRATLGLLDVAHWHVEEPASAFRPIPPELFAAFDALLPFISDNALHPWASSITLSATTAYATNNTVLACFPCTNPHGVSVLVPLWAVEFVVSRGKELAEWTVNDNHIAFRWSNGAWMRSQLMEGSLPDAAITMLSTAEPAEYVLTGAWKDAVLRVAELADGEVYLLENLVRTRGQGLAVEEELADTPVPASSESSCWRPGVLQLVAEHATHFDPSNWPRPCSFSNGDLFGVAAGANPT
jgi:hypothetical protein